MNVELWTIDRPLPYARNPRKNDGAVTKVKPSIREFGFKQPIVVDEDGVVVCGYTRLKAAIELNLQQVPVVIASDLTPAQVKAFRLTGNRVHDEASWDAALLPI
jgi:ParB family transcriptional regulator, chromosome partitioning protein